jgi:hypothetical protein
MKASRELEERINISLKQSQKRQMKQIGQQQNLKLINNNPWASSSYVTFCYISLKMLNLGSVLLQLYLLTLFLGKTNNENETFWGFAVIKDLIAGRDWHKSGAFPRVYTTYIYILYVGGKFRI